MTSSKYCQSYLHLVVLKHLQLGRKTFTYFKITNYQKRNSESLSHCSPPAGSRESYKRKNHPQQGEWNFKSKFELKTKQNRIIQILTELTITL